MLKKLLTSFVLAIMLTTTIAVAPTGKINTVYAASYRTQGIRTYGYTNSKSTTISGVSGRTIQCNFTNYYGSWNHVELLDKNGKVVWQCWVCPNGNLRNGNGSFYCGSNIKSIRISAEGVSRVDYTVY